MNVTRILYYSLGLAMSVIGLTTPPTYGQTTTFAYQGRLTYQGYSFNGNVDLVVSLWDAESGGSQIGSTITNANLTVTNGLFTVQLDFGADAFSGSNRWLGLRIGDEPELTPRQPVSSSPYAIQALHADLAETYTNTVADTQLSTNVAKLNANQTFGGSNVFTGTVKSVAGGTEFFMVPQGGIIIWSGSEGSIPSGWSLCNGANGTPDLRNRFVVGAGTGSAYTVGNTGGATNHTHDTAVGTPSTGSAGAHAHTTATGTSGSESAHTHSIDPPSTTSGSGGAHTHAGGTLGFRRGVDVTGSGSAGAFSVNLTSGAGANFLSPAAWNGTTASDGAHTHSINIASFASAAGSAHSHSIPALATDSQGNHTHSVAIGTITSSSAESRPPYYALCYIMKL